ncbi:MAG: DHA2 family efflux MFS transporter permease subunit [Caulobacteraceae bacterium]|nr:DHA2 family efflux MFS transporter permease subunit [Caulobacteraceae bacterium]
MSNPPAPTVAPNRSMILTSIMLSTIMTALDTTIANVALPHMAGSVSASADQITWVLTSYIVATAIVTPMTGWLAGRFGKKAVFVVSIVGFTIASALCGLAQSLAEIVIFRLLQGVFGAALMPLSQAVILDTYPMEERGPALAVWGMGVMTAPIVGPVLGGWLTDNLDWRWVFYINLPVGALSLLGVLRFVPGERSAERHRFDLTGFALLSVALAAFQLFLDRGENNDWFHSTETVIEASATGLALLLFLIHTVMVDRPFIPLELFKDNNFRTSVVISAVIGLLVFSVLALLPPMIETLLGYPVVTTGMVTAPRGAGSFISMFFAGRLVGRFDSRKIMAVGLALIAVSFFQMSRFNLQMDSTLIVISGFLQGLGSGLVFMPLNTLAFASLDSRLRADGAGVYTLLRNLGNSAGISVLQAMYTTNVQVVHARLTEALNPLNPAARSPYLAAPYSLTNPAGAAALNGEVTRQASMVSYVDVFHMMFLTTVAMIPFIMLLRPVKAIPGAPAPAMEH